MPRDCTERLAYLDALRFVTIAFVIVHHAAQAYGPTGGKWPIHDQAQSAWFRPFYMVNAAFGMALLFMLAGYFARESLERKGAKSFLAGRWKRIGVPLLIFALALHLPVAYLLAARPPLTEFVRSLYREAWQPLYLHLWFLGHLLLYSVVYVALRWSFVRIGRPPKRLPPIGHATIGTFLVGVTLATWFARAAFPVDRWIPLLWVVPAEPAHLPLYVAFFAAGAAAQRGDWFRELRAAVGQTWLGVGSVAVATVYVLQALSPQGLSQWNAQVSSGSGLSWVSLVASSWETLVATSLAVGLVMLFRERFPSPKSSLVLLAPDSYAAYIIHPGIVVALQAAILGISLPAVVKFALVSLLAVVLVFATAHLGRKLPGIRMALGDPHRAIAS